MSNFLAMKQVFLAEIGILINVILILMMLTLMKMILKPLFMSNLDKNYDNRYKRCNGYKQCKSCTKDISKGLLPVVWNPTR